MSDEPDEDTKKALLSNEEIKKLVSRALYADARIYRLEETLQELVDAHQWWAACPPDQSANALARRGDATEAARAVLKEKRHE